MMHRVGVAPEIIGREGQHAEHAADPVVQPLAAEERAVATVVLDHEQADEKTGGRYDQQQADPVAEMDAEPSEQPEGDERTDGDHKLDQAAAGARAAVPGQDLAPARRALGRENLFAHACPSSNRAPCIM
jgi:hypothetical protein